MPLGRRSRTFGICWWGFPSIKQGLLLEAFSLFIWDAFRPFGLSLSKPLARATQSERF